MKVQVRMCDTCRTEVDPYWPPFTLGVTNAPEDEPGSLDFCGLDCLRTWMETVGSRR